MPGLSMRKRYNDEQWLHDCYVTNRLSVRELAKICDCSAMTIHRALKRHGIETRDAQSGYFNWRSKKRSLLLNASSSSNWTETDEEGLEYLMELLGFDTDVTLSGVE